MVEQMSYTVDARDSRLNCLNIEMSFRPAKGMVDVCMAAWAPGSYQIEDFARHIVDISASGADGKAIGMTKKDKSTWTFRADGGKVQVKYRLHAHNITVHHSFVDDTHLTLNGGSSLLYARGYERLPAILKIIPREGWQNVSTGLDRAGDDWTFAAPDFDTLIDSPVEAGNHTSVHFSVAGKDHEVAIYGSSTIDRDKFASDVEKIVRAEIGIMKDVPYSRYLFIYDLLPGASGGLEHLNSTHCLADPFSFRIREDYLSRLSTISHEFFHLWNVKRLRPVPLGPFDYTKEVYTGLLWFSEGFTSYYTYIALRRAMIVTPGELLRSFARMAESYMNTPGRNYQSADESSFDTWIKLYKPDENSVNSGISYYTKGSLIGMLLDLHILDATDGRKRLDDVMRLLYNTTYRKGRGFTEEDFVAACGKVLGSDASQLCRSLIRGRGDLQFGRYLALAGLEMKRESERKEGCAGILMSRKTPETVGSVLEGMPAAEAGVFPGDEIIAVNGMRVMPPDFASRIRELSPREDITLTVARHGQLKSISLRLEERPGKLTFVQMKRASAKQKRTYEKWAYARWKDGVSYEGVNDSSEYRKRFDII